MGKKILCSAYGDSDNYPITRSCPRTKNNSFDDANWSRGRRSHEEGKKIVVASPPKSGFFYSKTSPYQRRTKAGYDTDRRRYEDDEETEIRLHIIEEAAKNAYDILDDQGHELARLSYLVQKLQGENETLKKKLASQTFAINQSDWREEIGEDRRDKRENKKVEREEKEERRQLINAIKDISLLILSFQTTLSSSHSSSLLAFLENFNAMLSSVSSLDPRLEEVTRAVFLAWEQHSKTKSSSTKLVKEKEERRGEGKRTERVTEREWENSPKHSLSARSRRESERDKAMQYPSAKHSLLVNQRVKHQESEESEERERREVREMGGKMSVKETQFPSAKPSLSAPKRNEIPSEKYSYYPSAKHSYSVTGKGGERQGERRTNYSHVLPYTEESRGDRESLISFVTSEKTENFGARVGERESYDSNSTSQNEGKRGDERERGSGSSIGERRGVRGEARDTYRSLAPQLLTPGQEEMTEQEEMAEQEENWHTHSSYSSIGKGRRDGKRETHLSRNSSIRHERETSGEIRESPQPYRFSDREERRSREEYHYPLTKSSYSVSEKEEKTMEVPLPYQTHKHSLASTHGSKMRSPPQPYQETMSYAMFGDDERHYLPPSHDTGLQYDPRYSHEVHSHIEKEQRRSRERMEAPEESEEEVYDEDHRNEDSAEEERRKERSSEIEESEDTRYFLLKNKHSTPKSSSSVIHNAYHDSSDEVEERNSKAVSVAEGKMRKKESQASKGPSSLSRESENNRTSSSAPLPPPPLNTYSYNDYPAVPRETYGSSKTEVWNIHDPNSLTSSENEPATTLDDVFLARESKEEVRLQERESSIEMNRKSLGKERKTATSVGSKYEPRQDQEEQRHVVTSIGGVGEGGIGGLLQQMLQPPPMVQSPFTHSISAKKYSTMSEGVELVPNAPWRASGHTPQLSEASMTEKKSILVKEASSIESESGVVVGEEREEKTELEGHATSMSSRRTTELSHSSQTDLITSAKEKPKKKTKSVVIRERESSATEEANRRESKAEKSENEDGAKEETNEKRKSQVSEARKSRLPEEKKSQGNEERRSYMSEERKSEVSEAGRSQLTEERRSEVSEERKSQVSEVGRSQVSEERKSRTSEEINDSVHGVFESSQSTSSQPFDRLVIYVIGLNNLESVKLEEKMNFQMSMTFEEDPPRDYSRITRPKPLNKLKGVEKFYGSVKQSLTIPIHPTHDIEDLPSAIFFTLLQEGKAGVDLLPLAFAQLDLDGSQVASTILTLKLYNYINNSYSLSDNIVFSGNLMVSYEFLMAGESPSGPPKQRNSAFG